ncbi:MAG: IPT/TIG domain-containing protein [Dokdonella sp.]
MTVLLCLAVGAAGAAQFTYDPQGRLQTVTDENNVTAEYVYDAVGNLLEVRRHDTDLVVTSFAPSTGPAGTLVTISGSGFASTTAGNTVTFNGAAATVVTASARLLTVNVPAGATSGRIAVTANSLTAQSTTDFTVTADSGAPTISDFTPKCALQDQTVTVTGTNFDIGPDATRVEVNKHIARATITSSTSLSFIVPRSDIGGRIRVTTKQGTAESSIPLAIWPSTWSCNTNVGNQWLNIDALPTAVAIPANQYDLVFFTGQAGQLLSLQLSGMTPNSAAVFATLIMPNGALGTATPLTTSSYSYHLPALPQSGTYAVRLTQSSATTSFNIQLQSNPLISVDGAGFALSTLPGQSRRVAVTVDGSSRLGIGVSPFSMTPTYASASIQLYAPDGSAVTAWAGSSNSCSSNGPGCHFNAPPNLTPGTYTLLWRPASFVTAPVTGTLWVSNDYQATLPTGATLPIDLARYGRNARLQFQGTAGTGISFSLTSLHFSTGSQYLYVYAFDPTGALMSNLTANVESTAGGMVTIPFLPLTGIYTILLTPDYGGIVTLDATYESGALLIVDGGPAHASSTRAGRGFRYVFDATKDEKLGIGLTNIADNAGSATFNVKVYWPNGALLTNTSCAASTVYAPGCELDLGPIPAGRYAFTIEPPLAATSASFDVQVSRDVEYVLTNVPQPIVISHNGGNARLKFNAGPGFGQTVTLSGLGTTPSSQAVGFVTLRPDSVAISARTPLYSGLFFVDSTVHSIKMGDFPIDGTYEVFVDPQYAATASFMASVDSGVDTTEPDANGAQIPVHKAVIPGPWARSVFGGSVGDLKSIGVDVSNVIHPVTSFVTIAVFDPFNQAVPQRNSTQTVASCSYVNVNGCDFDMPPLAIPGSYKVVVELPTASPADSTTQISVNEDIVINGISGTFNLDSRGQNGWLLFNGTAGHQPQLTLTRTSVTGPYRGVDFTLYTPSGTVVSSSQLAGTQSTVSQFYTLPTTGIYALLLDPVAGYATDITATITSP